MSQAIRVAVTGAAGQIGYSLLFRIASGSMFGPDQPVALSLIEIEPGMKALEGVVMELDDCAFPLLKGIVMTDQPEVGFKDANWSLLVGAKPRGPGMERADLLKDNGKIFIGQGQIIDRVAATLRAPSSSSLAWLGVVAVGIVALALLVKHRLRGRGKPSNPVERGERPHVPHRTG